MDEGLYSFYLFIGLIAVLFFQCMWNLLIGAGILLAGQWIAEKLDKFGCKCK